jgi:SEC-C motif/Aspartyl protease
MAKVGRNDPCFCGSGKKYKKCHGSVQDDREIMQTVKSNGFQVAQDFSDRQQLVRLGPVIKAEWRVHPEIGNQLKSSGASVPAPIHGYVLIDTGASDIAIDGDVARELGLTPLRRQDVFGSAGQSAHEVFRTLLVLYVGDVRGTNVAIGIARDVIAFHNIRQTHDAYGLKTPEGAPLRITGVLGRNFLQFTKLTYNGLEGNWRMQIDESVMRPYDPEAKKSAG